MFNQISRSFEEFSGANSFCINNAFYTYKDFGKRINGIISIIKTNPSQNVGIIIYDDIETYASILAVLFAGKTYVPLNPHNPAERNFNITQQAEIGLILTSRFEDIENAVVKSDIFQLVATNNILSEEYRLKTPEIFPGQNAYILFTSGSTGIPKGVPIQIKNLVSFAEAFFALGYEINEKDRFLQMFDLTFDLSIMSYLIPLCVGACVYTVPAGEIKFTAAYSILEEHQISVALMVPSILSFLRKYFDEIRLENMRYSLFCGEALFSDLTAEWAECVPNALVQNVYGPTEATIFCLTYDWKRSEKNKENNGIVCIGKPMKNIIAVIVDETLAPVANGTFGELCLSGGQLTAGYLKNPEKNKEAFFKISVDGNENIFYRTGDICCKDTDGDFLYSGRLDNQVKIQGFRVELSEIEHFAREYVKSNVVALTSQNANGNVIISLFVENFQQTNELHDYLKNKLPPYMIPAEILQIKNFPLNINGKIDRKALQKLLSL